jgi:hypothetical protein
MRAGTTTLHHLLGTHPAAFVSDPKELDFFNNDENFGRGVDWYRSFFVTDKAVRGESSPNYMKRDLWPLAAARAAQVVPDAKLLCMVRHPIERLTSHYVHAVDAGREKRPLEEVLAGEGVHKSNAIQPGCYAYQLEPWLEHFAREQIWIGTNDDLRHRQEETLRSALAFIGLDPAAYVPAVDVSLNAGERKVMTPPWAQRGRRIPGVRAVIDALPQAWLRTPVPVPTLSPERRAQLMEIYRPDIAALEAILGRPLGWE